MNPAYVPLVAALIQALALLVAVLVYRHSKNAQGNPFRLELYKQQLGAIIKLYNASLILEKKANCVPTAKGSKIEDYHKSAMAQAREFYAVWKEVSIILPSSIHGCLGVYLRDVSILFGYDPNEEPPTWTLEELRKNHKTAYRNLWVLCRKYMRASKVTEDINTLLGADPEMNRPA